MQPTDLVLDAYRTVLAELHDCVRGARTQAQPRVNPAVTELCWSIGRTLAERHEAGGWGSGVLNRVADDLRAEFPR
jgi:hypothetical protein